jgi:hypothetical protein
MKTTQTDYVRLYLPADARKVAHKHSDAVAYVYNVNNRPCVAVFYGKQGKPIGRFAFKTEEARADYVAKAFEARQQRQVAKAADRQAKKAWKHSIKVGDLFRASWGYDQTNIDYFEVIEVTEKMVTVREIAQAREATGWEQGKCVPLPGEFLERSQPFRALVQKSYNSDESGKIKVGHHYAYYEKPSVISGVPVYGASHWTSYA